MREHKLPALVLRRDVPDGTWTDHPASVVADVPAWLWPDARAAWTSWLETFAFAADREPWGARASALVHVVGDRRHARFLRAWHAHPLMTESGSSATGFVVPSLLDADIERVAHVSALRAGGHAYTQGWYACPLEDDSAAVDTRVAHPLRSISLAVALHDDRVDPSPPRPEDGEPDIDARTAEALAALHSLHADWSLLETIVDHLAPRPAPDAPSSRATRGEREGRSRLLASTLRALGHPPVWRRPHARPAWEAELTLDDVMPARDPLESRRTLMALPRDMEGRVVFVACDLEGERLLPSVPWRRPTVRGPQNPRWVELRALTFGADVPDADPSLIPVDARGAVAEPFSVVHLGDRLPRTEPALIVLLGEWPSTLEALSRICAGGKPRVPIIPCAIRGTPGDDGATDFFHAQMFVEWLVQVLTPRSDDAYALDAETLAQWFASNPSRGRGLSWIDIEVPASELHETMVSLTKGRELPLGVTVVSFDGDIPDDALHASFRALGLSRGSLVGAGTWDQRDMVKVTTWWAIDR